MSFNLPIVSIIGRRNVGKSTLFNLLIKNKQAIVGDVPGLTRDILNCVVQLDEKSFVLSDTPGLDLPSESELSNDIITNAINHLKKSSVIILLFENPLLQNYDHELINITRKLNVPVIIAVNKMDNIEDYANMSNFYELGIAELLPISSKFNRNIDMLMDKIVSFLPLKNPQINIDVKIAIVGKPNAGKSTLLNSFMGFERALVSDIPGTTRDIVNDVFAFENKKIEVIDTAGIRRKGKIKDAVEYFSLTRTLTAISGCDVVLHLIDAIDGITETDKKITDEIMKARRPIIIVINKWDMLEKDNKTIDDYKSYLSHTFFKTNDFPVISVSAKDKVRINKLLKTACELAENTKKKIETSKLNKLLQRLQKFPKLPGLGGTIKIYYASQVDMTPPRFKFFVNSAEKFRTDAVRYFEKEIQKEFNLKGIPIEIEIIGKPKRDSSGRKKSVKSPVTKTNYKKTSGLSKKSSSPKSGKPAENKRNDKSSRSSAPKRGAARKR